MVQRFGVGVQGPTPQVWIELVHGPGSFVCSGCGAGRGGYHDEVGRWMRDLPIVDAQTHQLVRRYRVDCPTGGPKLERLSWLLPWSRVTLGLAVAGPLARGRWSDFHRVLSPAAWSAWLLARVLASLIVASLPPNRLVLAPVDDTAPQHKGKKVWGKGRHHDAMRSTHRAHAATSTGTAPTRRFLRTRSSACLRAAGASR